MILSFKDDATADLYHGNSTSRTQRFPSTIVKIALRKLDMLEAAFRLSDLREPPGNRLELLRGALKGFYSIRVNEQWRIIFKWEDNNACDVQITDYH